MAVEYRLVRVEVPALPRGPRVDERGRRLAKVHKCTRERPRGYSGRESVFMPMLRLSGRWLEEAGFPRGRPIAVQVQEGRLVIEAL